MCVHDYFFSPFFFLADAHNGAIPKVLIVDEISMLDADTFDALEYVARELRESQASFGGIRLVLSGDFFQART